MGPAAQQMPQRALLGTDLGAVKVRLEGAGQGGG